MRYPPLRPMISTGWPPGSRTFPSCVSPWGDEPVGIVRTRSGYQRSVERKRIGRHHGVTR
jgi:hypothetical protein